MTMVLTRASTFFPSRDIPAWDDRVPQRSATGLSRIVMSGEISEVLDEWGPATEKPFDEVSEFPTDAVTAVGMISSRLNIAQDEVLRAVGVAERTFFGWRSGHRPRSTSQGRLWPMVQVVGRLSNTHPNLAAWFHSNEAARAAFAAGDVNALVLAELNWAVRSMPTIAQYMPEDGDLIFESQPQRPSLVSEDLEEADISRFRVIADDDE